MRSAALLEFEVENVAEKRKNVRISSNHALHYQSTQSSQFGDSLTLNVSKGGLRLDSADFLPMGSELELSFGSEEEMINCIGRVVWVEKNRYNDRYYLGVQFLETEAQSFKDKILKLVLINRTEKRG